MDPNIARFIRYCQIDTQSNEASSSIPSDPKELNLTRELQKDLKALGITTSINEFGILYGKLPGESGLDPIGLNSHVDTAQEVTDTNCQPRYISHYDGSTIVLNDSYSMDPKEFPTLSAHIGDDLVVTDGNTLLGADDKAGLAIIMAAIEHYVKHPEEKHHPICFCFTPDEEIGRGPDHFDAKTFGPLTPTPSMAESMMKSRSRTSMPLMRPLKSRAFPFILAKPRARWSTPRP